MTAAGLGWRSRLAVGAVRVANGASRRLGRGSGTVAGGRAGLAIDPCLLARLAAGRRVALVSGTNGKTTTTSLLVRALTPAGSPTTVATNTTGANMPAGHVAALVASPGASRAVLEVDEGYVARLVADTVPDVVVLLNLSRDQLDRVAEVRMVADTWREALAGRGPETVVVANADDPLVTYAARAASSVRWVGAGLVWGADAVGCPACGGRVRSDPGGPGWACDSCDLARPPTTAELADDGVRLDGGEVMAMRVALPGRFNRANALMAAVAAAASAPAGGIAPPTLTEALERIATVGEVAGRFGVVRRDGVDARLMLAKNPAGWTAILDLLDEEARSGRLSPPLVLAVNARTADGHDPSWLWDVPYERLAGRQVVATGDRCRDLAVRLRYAEVDHFTDPDPASALRRAGPGGGSVDVIANYTAFRDLREGR